MARPTIGPELRFKASPEVKAKLDAYAKLLGRPWYVIAREWMEMMPAPGEVREAWGKRLEDEEP